MTLSQKKSKVGVGPEREKGILGQRGAPAYSPLTPGVLTMELALLRLS